MSITNTQPIPATDEYWHRRRDAFALIRTLERAIKARNEALRYFGSCEEPDENIGPWDRVCRLQDQARQNPMVMETLSAQQRRWLPMPGLGGFSHLGQAHRTSQAEVPVKDARSPQNAAHFGSPAPRSAAPGGVLDCRLSG
ncbi:hypothetical protein [Niveispirillum sp.]|uniref:hypothetical protein n=1 Tax=Niveispirillum sp. TaxID=1917217 RepID=UPI001B79AEA8|nr:hypothetical protein [Niveispirillum sp.]MBP7339651.1 hypothetical protein [Niveispirillum sp.]